MRIKNFRIDAPCRTGKKQAGLTGTAFLLHPALAAHVMPIALTGIDDTATIRVHRIEHDLVTLHELFPRNRRPAP